MSASRMFECHKVSPNSEDSMDFFVVILSNNFMSSRKKSNEFTYDGVRNIRIVGFLQKEVVKVIKIPLPLEGVFVKRIEAIESEGSIQSGECCREPTLPQ